jgi:putative transposase
MSRPPRLKDFPYTGPYRYFLTFCTFGRRRVLTDVKTIEMVCTYLRECSKLEDIAVNAYCAMPDHVHLLTTGLTDAANLRHFIDRSKQRSGFTFKQRTGERLWQDGFYDHILREEDDVAGVVAYIVNNPIRAGLVASASDYQFWGSFTHTRDEVLDFIAGIPDWTPPL